jgi:hypothetical protein
VLYLVFAIVHIPVALPKNMLTQRVLREVFTLYCNNYPDLFVVLARFY